jgi:two-component system NtrC family sensor kinase
MLSSRLESANRMSDVIKKSTHYGMLLNRTEDVYQIITTIGKEPGVEGIRIYNKRGEIMFSTEKQEEHTVVDMHAEACYVCHDQAKRLESLPTSNRSRIYASPKGYRVFGLIDPIHNEASCSNADCHAHPADKTVLGVLDVRMSLEQVDRGIAQARYTMISYAVGTIVVVAFISIIFLSTTVTKPVRRLMLGVKQISSGNLDYRILIRSRDELGKLAQAFNEMMTSLQHEKEENRRWAATLQERIREKTEELKSIHAQILQIEKMASLGKLSATVAHELNNPLEAILTYAKLIARRIRKNESTTPIDRQTLEDIEIIARETDRCGNIVKNLLLFSRKQVGEFNVAPVKQIVERATQLVQHHLTISNVQLLASFQSETIMLVCDENQMQQALVALLVNGVEAMPEGGTIHLDIAQADPDGEVSITVSDTGVGILPEDLPHIFEPFFSTKKEVKGVGLGLSVVYGIVERHGGKIAVTSTPGKGTTFTLTFPHMSITHQQSNSAELLHAKDIV